jgi:hypothetical protein
MTLKHWIYTLIDSIINGIALAVLAYFVMPTTTTDLKGALSRLWIVALGGAIIGLFNHLRQSPISKIAGIVGIIFLVTVLFLPTSACAIGPMVSKSTCVWDANTELDLAGYYLYWRTPTGAFSNTDRRPVLLSANPTFNLNTLLLPSGVYVIAVSAYDLDANESGMSNEVTWDAAYPGNPKNMVVR